jgi:hypothetical protein
MIDLQGQRHRKVPLDSDKSGSLQSSVYNRLTENEVAASHAVSRAGWSEKDHRRGFQLQPRPGVARETGITEHGRPYGRVLCEGPPCVPAKAVKPGGDTQASGLVPNFSLNDFGSGSYADWRHRQGARSWNCSDNGRQGRARRGGWPSAQATCGCGGGGGCQSCQVRGGGEQGRVQDGGAAGAGVSDKAYR